MRGGLIGRRLAMAGPTLVGVAILVFAIGRVLPGDPALAALGMGNEGGSMADPAELARVRDELGLDQPAAVQFLHWFGNVLTGDLGRSYLQPLSVANLIGEALPGTLILMFGSMALAVAAGVPLGMASATWRGGWADLAARGIAIIGVGTPTFWLALVLVLLFAYLAPIFPMHGSLSEAGPVALVLPTLALAAGPAALIARITRSSMLEALSQDYVRTARAKGLSPGRVVGRHALRNAISPVVTVIGFQFGNLIGGAVAVEQIFGLHGLGTLLVSAITQKDMVVAQGAVLVISVVFIVSNLVVDLLYAVIDPRLRG